MLLPIHGSLAHGHSCQLNVEMLVRHLRPITTETLHPFDNSFFAAILNRAADLFSQRKSAKC